MAALRVDVILSNLDDRRRTVAVSLLVDPGATYTTLPREIAQVMLLTPMDTRLVRRADGHEEVRNIAAIHVRLGRQDVPSLALLGPPGSPAVLGAVTLAELALGVDPSGEHLIPIASLA